MEIPDWARPFLRRLIRGVFLGLIGTVGALFRLLSRPDTRDQPHSPGAILVIRLDLLGDVLFSMPAVMALREAYPSARIVMLTLPYTAPLARLYPSVDEVVAIDTNRIRSLRGLLDPGTWRGYHRIHRNLRAQHFDLCLSLSGRMASLCAFLSGARRTVGYGGEAYPYMLTDLVPGRRYLDRMHEVEYVRRLAGHAGASSFPSHLHVPVPATSSQAADRLLLEGGIGASDRVAIIHAGSTNGSAKRWPASNWARFAEAVEAQIGARVVIIGGRGDAGIAQSVLAESSAAITSLVGRTSIEGLIALLARADLVASGDSGPLHLAVALGRPVVAVYGPTDPEIYGPYHPTAPAEVHRRDLACSPCYTAATSAECPLGDPICMRLVSVRQMVDAAVRILAA